MCPVKYFVVLDTCATILKILCSRSTTFIDFATMLLCRVVRQAMDKNRKCESIVCIDSRFLYITFKVYVPVDIFLCIFRLFGIFHFHIFFVQCERTTSRKYILNKFIACVILYHIIPDNLFGSPYGRDSSCLPYLRCPRRGITGCEGLIVIY